MYIDKVRGRSLVFDNGLSIGFNYCHANGKPLNNKAVLASYHHPKSITWRWCLYWERAKTRWCKPSYIKEVRFKTIELTLPLLGTLCLKWQNHLWRNKDKRNPVVL